MRTACLIHAIIICRTIVTPDISLSSRSPNSSTCPSTTAGDLQGVVVSDDPSDITPHVGDGRVLAITTVGNKVIVGGIFVVLWFFAVRNGSRIDALRAERAARVTAKLLELKIPVEFQNIDDVLPDRLLYGKRVEETQKRLDAVQGDLTDLIGRIVGRICH